MADLPSESMAAAMVRRFREGNPTSRSEREIAKKEGAVKQMWWIDDTSIGDRNSSFKTASTFGSSSSTRRSYEAQSPVPQPLNPRQHQPPRRDNEIFSSWRQPLDYVSTNAVSQYNTLNSRKPVNKSLDASIDDDWIYKEIKNLGNDLDIESDTMFANKYRVSNFTLSRSLSPPKNRSPLRNRNINSNIGTSVVGGGIDTLYPLDSLRFGRNSQDPKGVSIAGSRSVEVLGNTGYLGLLDENLKLNDGTSADNPNAGKDFAEINKNLEDLLLKLKSEAPGYAEANGELNSVPSLKELDGLVAELAARDREAEEKARDEQKVEEGRKLERETKLLSNQLDVLLNDDGSVSFAPISAAAVNGVLAAERLEAARVNSLAFQAKGRVVNPLWRDPYALPAERESDLVQAAIDSEFAAADSAYHQMKSLRKHLAKRLDYLRDIHAAVVADEQDHLLPAAVPAGAVANVRVGVGADQRPYALQYIDRDTDADGKDRLRIGKAPGYDSHRATSAALLRGVSDRRPSVVYPPPPQPLQPHRDAHFDRLVDRRTGRPFWRWHVNEVLNNNYDIIQPLGAQPPKPLPRWPLDDQWLAYRSDSGSDSDVGDRGYYSDDNRRYRPSDLNPRTNLRSRHRYLWNPVPDIAHTNILSTADAVRVNLDAAVATLMLRLPEPLEKRIGEAEEVPPPRSLAAVDPAAATTVFTMNKPALATTVAAATVAAAPTTTATAAAAGLVLKDPISVAPSLAFAETVAPPAVALPPSPPAASAAPANVPIKQVVFAPPVTSTHSQPNATAPEPTPASTIAASALPDHVATGLSEIEKLIGPEAIAGGKPATRYLAPLQEHMFHPLNLVNGSQTDLTAVQRLAQFHRDCTAPRGVTVVQGKSDEELARIYGTSSSSSSSAAGLRPGPRDRVMVTPTDPTFDLFDLRAPSTPSHYYAVQVPPTEHRPKVESISPPYLSLRPVEGQAIRHYRDLHTPSPPVWKYDVAAGGAALFQSSNSNAGSSSGSRGPMAYSSPAPAFDSSSVSIVERQNYLKKMRDLRLGLC